MIRVGLDYRPALLSRSGIGRYVKNLVQYLPAVDDELDLSLFSTFLRDRAARIAAARLPDSKRVTLKGGRFPGRLLHALGRIGTPVAVETWTGPLDVFHYTDYVAPPVRTRPAICTLHDVTYLHPERFHTEKNRRRLADVARRLVESTDHVITVSETSRREIIEHYELDEDHVSVTPLGVDDVFLEPYEPSVQDVPYVLFVGTIEPRKNVARLLDAFERVLERGVESRLVLVGRRGWMCEDVFERLNRPGLQDSVTWAGEVADSTLVALMRNAAVLAYPSLWEGFGLPVLEGMAIGVPVLTSRCGAMLEVAGDAAVTVEPTSVEEIADGLERLLTDRTLAETLAGKGRERAQQYTWLECARKTSAVYRRFAGA